MGNLRIYVRSLSSYTAGDLSGAWIDATQGVDAINEQIQTLLRQSKYQPAEEWAIHDFDFGGVHLDEYMPVERIAKLAELRTEHGAAFAAWYNHDTNFETDQLEEQFTGAYQGEWASLEAYAEDSQEDAVATLRQTIEEKTYDSVARKGLLDSFDHLMSFVDYDHMGQGWENGGEIRTVDTDDGIYVFDNLYH